jgi:CelD/BcsL family acetyltransferase involved in cellulose biosynthesis
MSARTLTWQALSAETVNQWAALLREMCPLGNAFLSPSFVRAAGETYGRVAVCLIEDEGGLAAILPYQFSSALSAVMRSAERAGEDMNDYFGVVARAGFQCRPRDLLSLARLNCFEVDHLGEEQARFGLTAPLRRAGLRIELAGYAGGYWEFLTQADKKFASDTERRERNASRDFGPMRFTFAECDIASWRTKLLAEKRRQYLEAGKGDWLAMRGREKLVEILSTADRPECTGVISTLQFGDTWAAIHLGLRSHATLHYWLPVYNPELSAYAPGRLLLRQIILQASALQLGVIDRGCGVTQAKRDFPSVERGYFAGDWQQWGPSALTARAIRSLGWRWSAYRRRRTQGKP